MDPTLTGLFGSTQYREVNISPPDADTQWSQALVPVKQFK